MKRSQACSTWKISAERGRRTTAGAATQFCIVVCLALSAGCAVVAPVEPGSEYSAKSAPDVHSSETGPAHAPEGTQSAITVVEEQAIASSYTGKLSFEPGNEAILKIDGPNTFHAMFQDIDEARYSVHVETYILEDDEIGQRLAQHLIEARERGVKVRVMVDAFGSMELSEDYVELLESNGIELQKFHPIDPTEDLRVWRTNNRDHRKILVIDDIIAYTGGLNFSEVYREGSLSVGQRTKVDAEDGAWRDTQVRIYGPVVQQFQHYFLQMWNRDLPDEEQVAESSATPVFENAGDIDVTVVASSGGDDDEFDIYRAFTTAIEESKYSVWITQAYFAPNDEFLDALKAAAKRGVDVRLLLPGVSDASLVVQASRASYQGLLDSGVRIYERNASVLHAKTMVVDGVWSSVGSANFDYRSFVHNYELNAVMVSHEFGQAMEAVFEADLRQSEEVTLAVWKNRSIRQRFEEWLGNAFREWL